MSNQNYLPTLIQLKAFVAVARHQHFSVAAAELGVTQPTLSQSLSSLETGLGVQLIERSTRRVIITEVGQELLSYAENVLETAENFVFHAVGLSSDVLAGPLRLGIIPTVAPYLLPKILPKLASQYPHLGLIIVEEQTHLLIQRLKVGSIDVAIIALDIGFLSHSLVNTFVELPLYREDFVLATPKDHPLAHRDNINLDQLHNQQLLLLDEGHCLRDQTLEICRMAYNERSPLIGDTRAASLGTIVQCVASGLGVTLLPQLAVEAETAKTDLAISHFATPIPGRTVGLIYRSSTSRVQSYSALGKIISDAVSIKSSI